MAAGRSTQHVRIFTLHCEETLPAQSQRSPRLQGLIIRAVTLKPSYKHDLPTTILRATPPSTCRIKNPEIFNHLNETALGILFTGAPTHPGLYASSARSTVLAQDL